MQEIFSSFKQSLERFAEILQEPETVANRDASIQRFEFTIELAWKTVQKFLREQKIICRSPKECLKEAFKFGLIEDDEVWLKMIEDRNLTVHTYDEMAAREVYYRLPNYLEPLRKLRDVLQSEIKHEAF